MRLANYMVQFVMQGELFEAMITFGQKRKNSSDKNLDLVYFLIYKCTYKVILYKGGGPERHGFALWKLYISVALRLNDVMTRTPGRIETRTNATRSVVLETLRGYISMVKPSAIARKAQVRHYSPLVRRCTPGEASDVLKA